MLTSPIIIQNLVAEKIILLNQSIKNELRIKLKLITPKGSPENRSIKKPNIIIIHQTFLKSLRIIKRRTRIKIKLGLTFKKDKKETVVVCKISANKKVRVIKNIFIL